MTQHAVWHKAQAKLIKDTEGNLAMYWWAVGEKLNEEYGFTKFANGAGPGSIPTQEKDELTFLYKCSGPYIHDARRFHRMCPDESAANGIVREYGSWGAIRKEYLRGHEAGSFNKGSHFVARNAATRCVSSLTKYAQEQLGYADKAAARELVQDYMSDTEWFRKFAERIEELDVFSGSGSDES